MCGESEIRTRGRRCVARLANESRTTAPGHLAMSPFAPAQPGYWVPAEAAHDEQPAILPLVGLSPRGEPAPHLVRREGLAPSRPMRGTGFWGPRVCIPPPALESGWRVSNPRP